MSKKTIGIFGCGWLGLELAKSLVQKHHLVRGTVRREQKLAELEENNITPFLIELTEDKIYGDLQGFLEGLDVIIIDIPPGLRKNPESDFAFRIKLVMRFVQVYEIPQVIFVSSTSVFEDRTDIPVYDENSNPNATSVSGKKIHAAEQVVQEMASSSTIIRPCGLLGGDRHPIKMLAGKKGIKNPDAPINLVTRDHVMELIQKVINKEIKNSLVHAVSEPHEPREIYYQKAAEDFGLEAPVFEKDGSSAGKRIMSIVT